MNMPATTLVFLWRTLVFLWLTFFDNLGHICTAAEIAMVSAGLMMSDPNVAMTDKELVRWAVEQRTANMTADGGNE
jgi:hypothetical protein